MLKTIQGKFRTTWSELFRERKSGVEDYLFSVPSTQLLVAFRRPAAKA